MFLRCALALGLGIGTATGLSAQSNPGWWSGVVRSADTPSVPADAVTANYAPANLGQLKHFANQARLHLNSRLAGVGGSGYDIESMVAGWASPPAENYLPINLGQLKAVADKFYARLDYVGFNFKAQLTTARGSAAANWTGAPPRPWNVSAPADSNYRTTNLGQLKLLFSFDLASFAPDADGDQMADAWELRHELSASDAADGDLDSDGDGLTNRQEFQIGSNPQDPDDPVRTSFFWGQLVYFSFEDPALKNDLDQAPRVPAAGQTAAVRVPGVSGMGAQIDHANQTLVYDWANPFGGGNYAFRRGTVSLWVKPQGWGTPGMSGRSGRLFELGASTANGSKAFIGAYFNAASPSLVFTEYNGPGRGAARTLQSGTIDLPVDTWHQITVAYDEYGQSIYVDGRLKGAQSAPSTANPVMGDITAFGLKLGSDGGGAYFGGVMDEVEISSYRKTDGKVLADYRAYLKDEGDADGNGLGDIWERAYYGATGQNAAADGDNDGLTNREEYRLGYDPGKGDADGNQILDGAEDEDGDGLTNAQEYRVTGTNPEYFDTDGDLLGDGWERANGLNPKEAEGTQGTQGDGDGDGLDNFDEQMHGTNATMGGAGAGASAAPGSDSDGDGVDDGEEVAQGSDPNDSADGGEAPAEGEIEDVDFWVGDPSESHSERWQLTIKGTDPAKDKRIVRFQSREFGQVDQRYFKLRKGAKYELTLQHIATEPNWKADNGPDFDWQAQIGGKPFTPVLKPGQTGMWFMVGNSWIADNRSGLLGSVDENFSSSDHSAGKVATLLPVEFKEVSFGGTKYWELKSDDAAKTYSVPQWKDIDGNGKPTNIAQGERDYAVAFTRNTKPKIGVKFKMPNASNFGAIKIKATGPDGIVIPETAATVSGNEVTLSLTEASTTLVDTVKFYNKKDDAKAFKLDWEVKIGNSDWSKIGTTKHTVYVTLDDPTAMKDFNGNSITLRQETLFEIGCRNADGETTPAGATAKMWNEFTDRVVKRVDGTQMTYYNSYLCENTDAASLLEQGDGQCGAWADLLIRLRQIQGMNDTNEYRFFFSNLGPNVEGFAVKDWTFHGAGTSGNPAYPYLNILPVGNPDSYIGQTSYSFAYAEVTDDSGVPGQGNSNPASLFNNHQVMVSGEYYDPSYGVKRTTLAEIDNNAIAGFYKIAQIPLNEADYNLDLNQDGDKIDVGVPTYVFLFRKNPAGNDLDEQAQDR